MEQAGERSATAVDELRRHWRRHVRKAVAQPYLMALLAGSLLLSFASFFTTFAGMLNFMPVWLITFCIVFAIQALLFVTSWRMGFALADRERLPLFTLFVFLICLSTSVFFSWVALFERINDAETQERTRTARMQRAAEETVTELQARLLESRRQATQALLASPEHAVWVEQVERVAQTAVAGKSAIEAAERDATLESAARIAELEREKAEVLGRRAAAEQEAAAKERALKRLEEGRPALVERLQQRSRDLAEAEEKVVVQEGLMEAEAKGGAAGKGAGYGRIWRGLRDERNVMAADRDAKAKLVAQAELALEESDARMARIRSEIAASSAEAGAARLAAIEDGISRLRRGERPSMAAGVEQAAAAIRADLAAMATRTDPEPLDRVAARCAELLASIEAQPALSDRAAGLSCDRGAAAALLAPIRVMAEDQRALSARCAAGGAEAPLISSLGFEAATDFARSCMDLSGLAAERIADLRGEISRLQLEEAADASAFVKTVNAWRAGDKLAYFALAIAIFIDLLVLFSGLIGALSGVSAITQHFDRSFNRRKADNFVRALTLRLDADAADSAELWTTRAILRNAEPYLGTERAMRGFTAQIDLDKLDEPQLKGAIRQFLLGLYTDKLARPDEQASATKFYLKTSVLDALRHHLFEEGANPDRRVARAPAAPAPAREAPPASAPEASHGFAPQVAPLRATPTRDDAPANVVTLRREAGPASAADSNVRPAGAFNWETFQKDIKTRWNELHAGADDDETEDAPARGRRRPAASEE